ncbi:formate/nitrite transporter family protein [bacterium]|nr:formate/nitrite transporter family protein [bacterium]
MSNENIDIEMCAKPKQIAETFARKSMPAKVSYGKIKTLVLAIAAGAFISFGAQASLTAMAGTEAVAFGLAKILGGMIFSAGLMMIVFTGAELFTGNVLIGISVLEKKISIDKLFRNWFWVYIGNFIGAIIVATLIHYANAYHGTNEVLGVLGLKVAYGKVNLTFTQALASGILCNWLVCMAVWMAAAAKDVSGKIWAILFPITAFAMCGYEHCVANMYMITNGLLNKTSEAVVVASGFTAEQLSTLSIKAFLIDNLIPVTLGNIIGALIFVVGTFWLAYMKRK